MLRRLARWLWPPVTPVACCPRCGIPLIGVHERIARLEQELRDVRRLAWQRHVTIDRLRGEAVKKQGLPRF